MKHIEFDLPEIKDVGKGSKKLASAVVGAIGAALSVAGDFCVKASKDIVAVKTTKKSHRTKHVVPASQTPQIPATTEAAQ